MNHGYQLLWESVQHFGHCQSRKKLSFFFLYLLYVSLIKIYFSVLKGSSYFKRPSVVALTFLWKSDKNTKELREPLVIKILVLLTWTPWMEMNTLYLDLVRTSTWYFQQIITVHIMLATYKSIIYIIQHIHKHNLPKIIIFDISYIILFYTSQNTLVPLLAIYSFSIQK